METKSPATSLWNEYILVSRGWTPEMMDEHIGTADAYDWAKDRIYQKERVKEAEKKPGVKALLKENLQQRKQDATDSIRSVKPTVSLPERMYNLSSLKQKGWTKNLIAKYLDPPDVTSYHRKLYQKDRVRGWEKDPEVKAELQRTRLQADRDRAKKRNPLRYQALVQFEKVDLGIPRLPFQTLRDRAVEEYRSRTGQEPGHAIPDGSVMTEARLCVNFIRHSLSLYDAILNWTRCHKDVYQILNKRVYNEIAELYPELAEECERQLKEKLTTNV